MQCACAGGGALRINAESVSSIVVDFVTDHRRPSPGVGIVNGTLGCVIVTAHYGKGTELFGLWVLRGFRAGNHRNIQAVVIFNDLIDTTAAGRAVTPDGRVVVEIVHGSNDLEIVAGGIIGCVDYGFTIHIAVCTDRITLANLNAASDQVVVIGADCACGGEHALGCLRPLHAGAQRQIVVSIHALIDTLDRVSGGIHLINAGNAGLHHDFKIQCGVFGQLVAIVVYAFQRRTVAHKSHKVQLAIIFAGAAENRNAVTLSLIIQISGHENLRFAGLDIELEEHASSVIAVVLLPFVQHAVVHCVDYSGRSVFRDARTSQRVFDLRVSGQRAVHSAHVDPVAIGGRAVAVGLDAVSVARLADAIHVGGQLPVAEIIHDAVRRFSAVRSVGYLFKGITVVGIAVLDVECAGTSSGCKRGRNEIHNQEETHCQG